MNELSAGHRLAGRYTLERRLGLGGMGEVWLATVEGAGAFRRKVVLKTVAPDRRGDERIEDMLADEARVLGMLHHPGIVTAIDFLQTEAGPLLVLDYVDGPSLRTAIKLAKKRNLPMPEEVVAWIGAKVGRALDAAHRAVDGQGNPLKIVHRDVSPDNILLSRDGAVLLADFGVARAAGNSDVTVPGTAPKGKRGYMPPEQAMGQPVGPTADIYALGRVIEEAAGAHCGPALRAVLDKACAHDAPARYQTADEFAAALLAAVPPKPEPMRALIEWLAQAAPEVLHPRETSPGSATPPPEARTPRRPSSPPTQPAQEAPLFESVAPQRRGVRVVAAIGVGLALGLPLCLILAAQSAGYRFPPPLQARVGPATGELRVESSPEGAEIYIDGQIRGVAPLSLRLAPGHHELRVGSPKLERWRAVQVQIEPGRREDRRVDLTE